MPLKQGRLQRRKLQFHRLTRSWELWVLNLAFHWFCCSPPAHCHARVRTLLQSDSTPMELYKTLFKRFITVLVRFPWFGIICFNLFEQPTFVIEIKTNTRISDNDAQIAALATPRQQNVPTSSIIFTALYYKSPIAQHPRFAHALITARARQESQLPDTSHSSTRSSMTSTRFNNSRWRSTFSQRTYKHFATFVTKSEMASLNPKWRQLALKIGWKRS